MALNFFTVGSFLLKLPRSAQGVSIQPAIAFSICCCFVGLYLHYAFDDL
jgi:hypothetical protein